MKFKVTSTPTHCEGEPRPELSIGDVVEIADPTPDEDGDVFYGAPGSDAHVALSCLTPLVEAEDEEKTPRTRADVYREAAALTGLHPANTAQVLAVAQWLAEGEGL